MNTIVAFYKFVPITDMQTLRTNWKKKAVSLDLKGTILIASEGINGSLAGSELSIKAMQDHMKSDERFSDLEFKISYYSETSFRRMLVKLKKEIITMHCDAIDPNKETGKYLDPIEFKKWQDEGKDILIVDTRNDYEVAMGTFENAIDPKIKTFSQFPEWVDKNLQDDKEKVIVTFCTGGIRCEKATAYMVKKGFKNVYQLKGGILKYFEEVKEHTLNKQYWLGDCVVFDKRKAIKNDLSVSNKTICYSCLKELTPSNRAKEIHPAGEVCVECADTMARFHQKRLERGLKRHQENLKNRDQHLKEVRRQYNPDPNF